MPYLYISTSCFANRNKEPKTKKQNKKQVHSPHQISHHNPGKRAEEREWGGAKGKKQKGPRKEMKGRIGADRE